METFAHILDTLKSIKEVGPSVRRPLTEFFDYRRASKPTDLNQAVSRIRHNIFHFSGNYGLLTATLAVYAILTNYLLLISVVFLVFGFAVINRFAPETIRLGEHQIARKNLFTGLFVIGLPLLWLSSPISTIFWLVGASVVLILGHASFMEPGIESDQARVEEVV